MSLLSLHRAGKHRSLLSFPTRRSSDLEIVLAALAALTTGFLTGLPPAHNAEPNLIFVGVIDRKSTRLNSSHVAISYAVFCLKKKTRCSKTKLTIGIRS